MKKRIREGKWVWGGAKIGELRRHALFRRVSQSLEPSDTGLAQIMENVKEEVRRSLWKSDRGTHRLLFRSPYCSKAKSSSPTAVETMWK